MNQKIEKMSLLLFANPEFTSQELVVLVGEKSREITGVQVLENGKVIRNIHFNSLDRIKQIAEDFTIEL
jgi:hypothetical protein